MKKHNQTPSNPPLDAATCSRSVLENLVNAINQFGGGASLMHPRLTRALMRAQEHLRGTNEKEGMRYDAFIQDDFIDIPPEHRDYAPDVLPQFRPANAAAHAPADNQTPTTQTNE